MYDEDRRPSHGITAFFRSWADGLTLGLQGLFTSPSPVLQVVITYGLAAVGWLIIGAVVAGAQGARPLTGTRVLRESRAQAR